MNYKLNPAYINEYGNSYWKIIHLEAFKLLIKKINNVDINELKHDIDSYFLMLSYLIDNMMCSCKNHATRLILINKFDFDNDDIFKWTIDLHNSVNLRLNKKILTYDETFKIYSKFFLKFD